LLAFLERGIETAIRRVVIFRPHIWIAAETHEKRSKSFDNKMLREKPYQVPAYTSFDFAYTRRIPGCNLGEGSGTVYAGKVVRNDGGVPGFSMGRERGGTWDVGRERLKV
jgi:hypothetical protein